MAFNANLLYSLRMRLTLLLKEAPKSAETADLLRSYRYRLGESAEAIVTEAEAALVKAKTEAERRGELSEGLVAKLASDLRVSPAEASTQLTQAIEGLRAAAAIATGMTDPADQTAFDAWLDESPDRVRRSRMAARSIGQENDLGPLRKLVNEWRKGLGAMSFRLVEVVPKD